MLAGGHLVLAHRINVGQFVAFITYMIMLIWPIIAVGWVINIFQRGTASVKRIDEILKAEPAITVDLGESDPNKAVTRSTRPRSDIARSVADNDGSGDETDTSTSGCAERSKEVNRRLARQARSLNRTFDQKLADREAEHQRQLSDLRKDMDKLRLERGDGDAAKVDADHERAMAELKAKLEAAIEAGNSAQQAQITADMQRKEGEYWAKKAAAAGVAQREQRTDPDRQQQQQRQPKPGQPTAAGSRFILANEAWWEDPDYAIEKQAAGLIFAQLRDEEDYDANSDETFREVAKRLKAKFPQLEVVSNGKKPKPEDDDDDEELGGGEGAETRRAPSGALQDRGAGGANNGGRMTLSNADIATMRQSDLDPNNNKHVLQFMREKQAYESAEASH